MSAALRRSCFLVLVGLLLVAAPSAQATFPGGANGKIVFQSDRDGNYEIYSMDPNGANQTRLTNNAAIDEYPKWSADGTKIIFDSSRDGNLEIYTMNADGTGQTRITNNAAFDELGAWSPDGTKIVFDSGRADLHGEIYTMNANGTAVTRLTNDPGYDFAANWSPDGTKIAWQTSRNSNQFDIYDMNPDGTTQTRITTSPQVDQWPNWSNDGLDIWYDTIPGGDYDLYLKRVADLSTGYILRAGDQIHPAPPPNEDGGVGLVYEETVSGNTDIYNDGFRLTTNSAEDSNPDWQPIIQNHVRPKGATPLFVPLVPAQKQCGDHADNSRHQPPLNIQSCVDPKAESTYLTVGTPDVNAEGANFIGSVRISSRTTAPADGLIRVSTTDVRCAGTSGGCTNGALADYVDDLRLQADFRITDRSNAAGNTSGTVPSFALNFSVPCTSTASAATGSTCSTTTTFNTILGAGAITAGKRAIWQLNGGVQLFDGGADGVGSTTGDNTLFAVGGLFFP